MLESVDDVLLLFVDENPAKESILETLPVGTPPLKEGFEPVEAVYKATYSVTERLGSI